MQIHQIKRVHPNKKSKLVARGGKRGKTAGKGGKGQTARAGHRVRPAMRDIIKKLPKLRGYGKNRAKSVFDRGPETVVNVNLLNVFEKGAQVTPETLLAKGIIKKVVGRFPKIKILGTGDITTSVNVSLCEVSVTAKEKIEKAGGTVTLPEVKEIVQKKEKKEKKTTKKAPAKKK
jgi:large subunit ribosomal protein L15